LPVFKQEPFGIIKSIFLQTGCPFTQPIIQPMVLHAELVSRYIVHLKMVVINNLGPESYDRDLQYRRGLTSTTISWHWSGTTISLCC